MTDLCHLEELVDEAGLMKNSCFRPAVLYYWNHPFRLNLRTRKQKIEMEVLPVKLQDLLSHELQAQLSPLDYWTTRTIHLAYGLDLLSRTKNKPVSANIWLNFGINEISHFTYFISYQFAYFASFHLVTN